MSALGAAYAGISRVVEDLDDLDLLLPSGCHGWSIADLLLHLTLDAQRALIAFATPAAVPADVDAISYWRTSDSNDPEAALAHIQRVRRSAAAFGKPSGVVRLWSDTAPAAVRAAEAADPDGCVATQGHVLTVPDFTTTLVTEAVIHHLDLIMSLPGAAEPAPAAITVALSTLDGLAGPDGLPARWEPREALLKGAGRQDLDAADRRALGGRAEQFPLLG
ncbi:MAG TPA: maleylpyruvate isomerase N-terminal domain-containing protein [Actinoplanes sp.]|nr:maleylpyruvate isomerase N-terminal domain-containing protein [Actinoplanes sp.]